MRIALFGGSFDPPHRGHLAIARAAADTFALDRVLFAPTARQPLKPAGSTAVFADRLAMVALLCREDTRFEASTLEGPRPDGAPNFMIDTLHALRAQSPADTRLYSIAGADSFLDLRRWRSPDALLQAAEWIVVSRPGFPLLSLPLTCPPSSSLPLSGLPLSGLDSLALTPHQLSRVHLITEIEESVTATTIRECLLSGIDSTRLMPPAVHDYIREHGLYGVNSQPSGGELHYP